jgi:hypothetical protein
MINIWEIIQYWDKYFGKNPITIKRVLFDEKSLIKSKISIKYFGKFHIFMNYIYIIRNSFDYLNELLKSLKCFHFMVIHNQIKDFKLFYL